AEDVEEGRKASCRAIAPEPGPAPRGRPGQVRRRLSLGGDLVLRPGVEVGGVVPLAQLARGIAGGTIDLAAACHGGACEDLVSPAVHVLVLVGGQERRGVAVLP